MQFMNQKRELLWFGAGFAIAAVLSESLGAVRYLPIGVAFGLLCFLCGLLLHQFVSAKQERVALEESRKSALRLISEFQEKDFALLRDRETWESQKNEWGEEKESERSELQGEKEILGAEKQVLEEDRKQWEEDKESAFCIELQRMAKEEPDLLAVFLDFTKEGVKPKPTEG